MKLARAAPIIAAIGASGVSPAAANLRGGNRGLQDGQASQVVTEGGSSGDCVLVAADHLMIPGEDGSDLRHRALQAENDLEWGCELGDGTIAPIALDPVQQDSLGAAIGSGGVVSGDSVIDVVAAGGQITANGVQLPPGYDVVGNSHRGGAGRGGNGRASTGRGRRNLAQLVGNKYTLVVKGVFNDYPWTTKTAAQISDDVFGIYADAGSTDQVNLASQLYDCSYGKLVTVPGPDPAWNSGALTSIEGLAAYAAPGTLEINMGVDMTGMTKADIYNLFVSKTVDALGGSSIGLTSLPGPFDHVIFARETCLTECGWAAYAYINSWGQMFQGNYISQTGVQVHEMGHNLNLAHSGSQGISWSGGSVGSGGYTDHTCLMGNPLYSDEVGKMCFNPAKNYQISGWYDDAKVTLDPMGFNGPPSAPWEGDIVGVGEYDLRTNNEPVTIKIETGTAADLFVGFNRAAGPNEQNDLADNQVNVIQVDGNNGLGYSQSQLRALLDGSTYTEYTVPYVPGMLDYADLKVRVNSIDTSSVPWKANMRIGYDPCTSDTQCQALFGGCYTATCQAQGTPGADQLGCVPVAASNCCGNAMCEGGESSTSCAVDCLQGPNTIHPDDCSSCWIRDGGMFDVEAKPDADLSITEVQYKAYTSTGNVRLYYRVGGKAGYASGTSLTSNGWVYVTQAAACGAWSYCTIPVSTPINVPRGTKVGILVTYDNGGDILYYNNNFGIVEDDYALVHPGTAVNFALAGEIASSFHNALMFSGKVTYTADLTSESTCGTNADCDDGDACNGAETCNAGTCQAGTAPDCGVGYCDVSLGCVACLNNGHCDDNNVCNGAETCDANGTCQPGTSLNCDDGVACTVDTCDALTGCSNTPNDSACDNGVFCDGVETCDAGSGCQPAASGACDVDGPLCNETTDTCYECDDNSDCDDGNVCNGAETCDANGTCQPGTPLNCDDGVACTDDTCDSTTGCSNTPNNGNCDNSLFCDGTETCDVVLGCQSGTAPTCSAPNDKCSEALDECVQCLAHADCDDGVGCTVDTCDASGTCVHTPDNSRCDNGLFCDGAETCDAQSDCQAGSPPVCGGTTPQCDNAAAACICSSVSCDDGNACNGLETCVAGSCQAGTSVNCDDGIGCTTDTCDSVTGNCSNTPNDGACTDPANPFCSVADSGCAECLNAFDCDDGVACTDDVCSGGTCSSTPNNDNCAAGQVCDATAGCLNQVTVLACAKESGAPTEAEACAAGTDSNCNGLTAGQQCHNSGKICLPYTCTTSETTTTTAATTTAATTTTTGGGGGGGPVCTGSGTQLGGSCSGSCSECCCGKDGNQKICMSSCP